MAYRVSNFIKSCRTGAHEKVKKMVNRNFSSNVTSSSVVGNEATTISGSASKGGSTVNIPSTEIVTPLPPLTEPLPNLPEVLYATVRSSEDNVTQVTTLSNGLKVASEKRFGQFCTIGVVIDSGPRYEVAYPSGVSHFLEKLAFNSTENFENKDLILKELEKHGGICDCQSSRDTFIYAASIDSRAIESVTRLLADVTMRPKLENEEVDFARQAVDFDLQALGMRPEQDTLLTDMVHAAAFRENTLGLPKICPGENLNKIDRNILMTYLKNHHSPERMVVAGVGVDHEIFCNHVEKYFVNDKPIWETERFENIAANTVDNSISQYTGGMRKEMCDIPCFAVAELPELAHIAIGVEGCSHQDPDFIASCVLNIMMGGGGSFSAGGPGKGMYTRLYTNVLNRYHWMFSATAFNHGYNDTGLFCIHASAPPSNVKEMVEVIANEMLAMATTKPEDEELRRAKTQLQSMLLMNLEARPVVFEDIGRQVLVTGKRKQPIEFIREIENISAADIQRVASRFLSSVPAVAARGDIRGLPDLKAIQSALAISDKRFKNIKNGSFFS